MCIYRNPAALPRLWISAKKPHPSFPLQLAMAVWSKFGFYHYKWIVVTDEDVNVRDPFVREWVLAFRVRPEKDIHVTPEVAAMTLDPSATQIQICHRAIEPAVSFLLTRQKNMRVFPKSRFRPRNISSKRRSNGKVTASDRSI